MLNKLAAKVAILLGEQTDYGSEISPSMQAANDFLAYYSLSDILPYLSFDDAHNIFYNKHSTGFIIETCPLIGSSDDIERQLLGIFQHNLPEGSNLQFLLIASSRVQDWLDKWQEPRSAQSDLLKTLAKSRVDFLQRKVRGTNSSTPYRLRNYKVIISYSQHGAANGSLALDSLTSLQQQLTTTLESIGVSARLWNATDLIRGLDEIVNLDSRPDVPNVHWNEHQDLSSQIVSPANNLIITKDGILQDNGKQCMRCYTVRGFPRQWCLSEMGNFIGDNFNDLLQIPMPFIVHYGVHICSEKTLKSRMMAKCSQVERQANSPIAKWVPSLTTEVQEWGFVREQFESGQRLVRTRMQVALLGATEQIDNAEQLLFNLYRSNRWELIKDRFLQLPSLISMLPMTWGEGAADDNKLLSRTKTTLSHETVNLLPLQGEWQGTQSPGMLLASRRGQMFYWDSFDNDAGNYNTCVVGRSGSGKSVFMQEIVASTLGQGGRVFVLDVGRSFEKTVKLLEGSFIEFTTESPICINPFSSIPVDSKDTTDALAMLKPVISLMAAPIKGTDDLEQAFIEKAIHAAWAKKSNAACITDVANELLSNKDKKAQDLGNMLYPYTDKGSYGRFFNGIANIDLSAKLVVIEFEELKERKDLQAVIVQMVILQITNQVYMGDRKTKSRLVLDEAWDMLRGKQSGEFIETAARRLRKYHGALVVGTQSVNDFYATPGAQAAFDNSDWLCLLSQKRESIEQLKKSGKLVMEPYMEKMLRSVTTRQGQYAEVMVYGPYGFAIGRLLLDPYSRILYSTKAEEYALVQKHQSQGLSLAESVKKTAKELYND